MARVPIRAYLGDQQLSRNAVRSSDYYERPKDWLVLPSAPEPQGVRALVAVFPGGNNFYSVVCRSAYTVNWGDGTVTNHADNSQANYSYNYNNLSPSTECSRGYRQAIVTITPQTGQNLSYFQLARPTNVLGLNGGFRSAWLDINVNLPNLISGNRLIMGGGNGYRYLERVYIKNWGNLTSLNSFLYDNLNIKSLNEHEWDMSKITSLQGSFTNCSSIEALDTTNWNLSGVTTMGDAFAGCTVLKYIHGIEKWNLSNVTFLNNVFSNALTLKSSDDSDTLNLSNWKISNKCTNISNLFNNSFARSNVRALNVSNWDTSKVTTAERCFQACGCQVLNLSSWNLSACTMSGMFHGALAHTIYTPVLNLSSNPNMFDSTIAGSFFGFAYGCNALQTIVFANSGINSRISFFNCQFSAPSLNYIFQNLSNDGAGKTITITGSWGISAVGFDQTIATNKGWTVVR